MMVGTGCAAPEDSTPSSNIPPIDIVFEDITRQAGLGAFQHETGAYGKFWFPETMGAGAAFLDYDGDGWLDVLLVGGGQWSRQNAPEVEALQLYRNTGQGTFENVTEAVGLASLRAYGQGVHAADYDNDGDQDIFFTTLHQNFLLRNDGQRFVDVTHEAGLDRGQRWSTTAIFFDADRDGWLDLYVGNYVVWSPEKDIWCSLDGTNKSYCSPQQYDGEPAFFYKNNGDGTFSDVTEIAGMLPTPGKTLGVVALDANDDGWPDLLVSNDTQRNLLYINDGDGTFTEQGLLSGVAFDENGVARAGMGIDAGDIENNGDTWIFIGTFAHEMIGVYQSAGNGFFMERSAASQIGRQSLLTLNFGLFLFDVELDGDLDVLVANGHIYSDVEKVESGLTYRQPTQLFINQGDATFLDVMPELQSIWANPLVARGAIYGDIDRDGDLDVLITENGGPVHLWRNDTRGGNYLRVQLTGVESNRDGIGAHILVRVDTLKMQRIIRTGSTYMSQSELTASFGLGNAETIDTLKVFWPSGTTDVLTAVKANQVVVLKEGETASKF